MGGRLVLARHLERFGTRVIHTPDAPSHVGPVPQAVEAGGRIHVSALFGATPGDRTIPGDARAEARFMIEVAAFRG